MGFDYKFSSMEYREDSVEPHIDKRFERLQKIGSGAYGYVWKVKEKATNSIFALKKVFLAFQNDVDAQRTYRQISILRQLDHPNVIKLKQVIQAENQLDLYLVFEHVECDLFAAIRDGVLNDVHKKYIIYQLAKGLVYLHSAGVLHRDLKPSNILIDSSCNIKICDFGLSRTLYKYKNQEPLMTEFIATRWYRAPEVLFGSRKYAEKSDMWSLGCLIFELFACRPLFPGNDSVSQIEKILQMKGFPTPQQIKDLNVERLEVLLSHFKTVQLPQNHYFKPKWSPQFLQLLRSLLNYSPFKRWTPQQVMKCEFISQFHNYQQASKARSTVALSINDNIKNDKDFYRSFITRFFIKKTVRQVDKSRIKLYRRSESPGRKMAETSTRKKHLHNSSMSLHHCNNSKGDENLLVRNKSRATIHHTFRQSDSKRQSFKQKAKENVSPNLYRRVMKWKRKSSGLEHSAKKVMRKRQVL